MIAGLPGVGITGLFFVLSALAMPFVETYRLATGTSTQRSRRLAARQFLLAVTVVATLFIAVAMIARVIPDDGRGVIEVIQNADATAELADRRGLPVGAGYLAIGALVAVLGGAWLQAIFHRRRSVEFAKGNTAGVSAGIVEVYLYTSDHSFGDAIGRHRIGSNDGDAATTVASPRVPVANTDGNGRRDRILTFRTTAPQPPMTVDAGTTANRDDLSPGIRTRRV